VEELYRLRQRKGMTEPEARKQMQNTNVYASMMVRLGDADALVSGVAQHYPDTIRPALQIIKVREGVHKVSAMYMIVTRKGEVYFLSDVAVNTDPTAEDLAEIALCTAQEARRFNVEPRVAMLAFSNFGSTVHPLCEKVRKAVALVRKADPTLMIDGEMMADTATVPEILGEYPFSTLQGSANVLIFPDLQSGNIAYKLLMRLGGAEAIGPVLMGMSKPVHVLQRGATVEEIVNVAALAVVDAQELEKPKAQKAFQI
jgi:malate dehydrogenase (oxaloacetate-decarboxylating)(NADP+)